MSTEDLHANLVLTARHRVHAVAIELAKQGLSPETIREAMLDMGDTAATCAEAFIARYDEAEARAQAEDKADIDDEREARQQRYEAAQ